MHHLTLHFLHIEASSLKAAMEERNSKLRRLSALGVPHLQLTELVARLQSDGFLKDDAPISRKVQRRSVDVLWQEIGQAESLALIDGEFTWQCVSFAKVLQLMVKESSGLRGSLRTLWEQKPCTSDMPYHLVIYADEVVPGNVLRLDNKRKVFCVYVSIREVGPLYLKNEFMWLPIAVIRSAITKDVNGGISACMKVLFRRLFLLDKLQEDGVLLNLEVPCSRYVSLYFALGNVVADGDAYRATWSAKGASGKLPCILCKNVKEPVQSDYLVHRSCPHVERFDSASSSDIWEKADKLHEQASVPAKKMSNNFKWCSA